jgi:hypothetical protein
MESLFSKLPKWRSIYALIWRKKFSWRAKFITCGYISLLSIQCCLPNHTPKYSDANWHPILKGGRERGLKFVKIIGSWGISVPTHLEMIVATQTFYIHGTRLLNKHVLPYCRRMIVDSQDARLAIIRKGSQVVLLGSKEKVAVCNIIYVIP